MGWGNSMCGRVLSLSAIGSAVLDIWNDRCFARAHVQIVIVTDAKLLFLHVAVARALGVTHTHQQ